jgi:hypothetical protein
VSLVDSDAAVLSVAVDRKESGECKFGENCRFAHENIPEGARGAEAKAE